MQRACRQRRYAVFAIPQEDIENETDKLARLLSTVVVYDARYDYSANAVYYSAISPSFEPVPEGQMAPLVCVSKVGWGVSGSSWEYEFSGE